LKNWSRINSNQFNMKNKPNPDLYLQMQRFANVTKSFIRRGDMDKARRCLRTAEEIYCKGSAEIRNALVNVYVFSVSTFLEIRHAKIEHYFPASLQAAYYQQVNTSGL